MKKFCKHILPLTLACAMVLSMVPALAASPLIEETERVETPAGLSSATLESADTSSLLSATAITDDDDVTLLADEESTTTEQVNLAVGASTTLKPWFSEKVTATTEPNSSVASYTFTENSVPATSINGGQGYQSEYGTGVSTTKLPLASALLRFNKADESGNWYISHRSKSGELQYLTIPGMYFPFAEAKSAVTITSTASTFNLSNNGTNLRVTYYAGYGYYWVCGSGTATDFSLYRPVADDEQSSAELPGYVKLSGSDELKDGGFYLLVTEKNNSTCVVYPAIDAGYYDQFIIADKDAESVDSAYYSIDDPYTLTITAVAAGTTQLVVGDIKYAITVVDKEYLNTKITAAKEYQKGTYTPNSWRVLQDAISAGEKLYADADAKADDLTAAYINLLDAIDALSDYSIPSGGTEYTTPRPSGAVYQDTSEDYRTPFPSGTGGSKYYRIPALLTLKNQTSTDLNGRVVASVDARWNNYYDAGALDTIVSYSDDGGKNWNFNFAHYFEDSIGNFDYLSTTNIDSVLAEGDDGTIYLMTDTFPGGIATGYQDLTPQESNGYEEVDGEQRLVLYTMTFTGTGKNKSHTHTDDNWSYWVGDWDNGYAPVYHKNDTTGTSAYYYIDEYYNLYANENGIKTKMYCERLQDEGKYVQQNVFYYNADLHVRYATFLGIYTSTDGGETWSAPHFINDQVNDNWYFVGVAPGAGLTMDGGDLDGTIVLPVYVYEKSDFSIIYPTFIYSDDGENWELAAKGPAGGTENFLVQLNDTTLRMFYRNTSNYIQYSDFTWDSDDNEWTVDAAVTTTAVKDKKGCQLSGVLYSEQIDGKRAIMVATPASSSPKRHYGRIYTFLLDDSNSMELAYTYDVNAPTDAYTYSSMTELADGKIALLYEATSDATKMEYEVYTIAELTGKLVKEEISLYDTIEVTCNLVLGEDDKAALAACEIANITVSSEDASSTVLSITALKTGKASFDFGSDYGLLITVTDLDEDTVTDISLRPGRSAVYPVSDAELTVEPDEEVVTATVEDVTASPSVTGGTGKLGTSNAFDTSTTALANALYQFNGNVEDGFVIVHYDDEGNAIYMNHSVNNAGYPGTATYSSTITVSETGDNQFYLAAGSSLLYFHRSGSKFTFDRYNKTDDACKLMLYRPAKDSETSSEEVPGYVRINALSEIENRGFYLIVAYSEGGYYALYPSTSTTDKYAHVIKIDSTSAADAETATVYGGAAYDLTLTAVNVGSTYLALGHDIYRITVSRPSSGGSSSSTTVKNEDGSTTTTTVDKTTGAVTETTKTTDGTVSTVVTDTEGKSEATVDLSSAAISGEDATVTLPVDGSKVDEISITLPKSAKDEVKVEVPVENVTSGTVLVLVHEDGTEEVVKKSALTENGVALTISENVTLKVVDNSKTFTDVPETHWALDEGIIDFISSREIMVGNGAGGFDPDSAMQRCDLAVVLHNLENNPAAAGKVDFSDLTETYYTEAVAWASEQGLVNGYDNGTYGVNDPITREQFAAILYRYAGSPSVTEENATANFSDADQVSTWAADAMAWAVATGILNGADGALMPGATATRAQVAAMLMRFINL